MQLGIYLIGLYLLLLVAKAYLSLRYARSQSKKHLEGEENSEALTIMQPILSGDPLLSSSLKHNLEYATPQPYFMWLVDEDDSEAQRVTCELKENSSASIEIIFCPRAPERTNPKTFKLEYAFNKVQTPLVAVLDDDTLLSTESLEQARHSLQTADVYTGLPYYLPGSTFWAALVAHFVNNNSVMTYLPLLNFMAPLSLNGMFYMMRRTTLERVGGFAPILNQLGDDYAMARLVRSRGGIIHQGIAPQSIQTSVRGISHYLRLMQRWFLFAQLQVADQSLSIKLLLFMLLGLPPLLLLVSILSLIPHWTGIILLVATLLLRHFILRRLQHTLFPALAKFSFFISIFSECLQPFHMLHAALIKRIRWRSRDIRLQQNGTFVYLEEP
jgi:ceramide glucosyltransferase